MDIRRYAFLSWRRTIIVCLVLTVLLVLALFPSSTQIKELNIKKKLDKKTQENQDSMTLFKNITHRKHQLNRRKISKENLKKENETLKRVVFDFVKKNRSVIYTTVVLISSHVSHTKRRNLIRNTWGNSFYWSSTEKYLIVFVVGKVAIKETMMQMQVEANVTKDILYLNVTEDFYLLAEKVIIGLTWAKHNLKFKAILKGDDDTFMNLDNILTFIIGNNVTDGYFGNKIIDGVPERIGRYKVTIKEWDKNYYYPYCSGGGFLLTNSSVYKMIPIFDLNKIFRIDDAFIGEIAFQAGITVDEVNGFYMKNDGCEYRNDTMVSHPSTDLGCNSFLLRRHLIDNKKIPRDAKLESIKCYRSVSDC